LNYNYFFLSLIIKLSQYFNIYFFLNVINSSFNYNLGNIYSSVLIKNNPDEIKTFENNYNEIITIHNCIKTNDLKSLINYIENNSLTIKDINDGIIPYDLLLSAIDYNSNSELIEYCISLYNNLNYSYNRKFVPIFHAVSHNNFLIVDKLIKKGANINYQNDNNEYLLNYLFPSLINQDNLKYIIKNEVNINCNLYNKNSNSNLVVKLKTFFNLKSKEEIITCFDYFTYELCINKKVNILPLLELLIKYKNFDVTKINKKSIELITINKFYTVLEWLINYKPIFINNELYIIALKEACHNKDDYILNYLIKNINNEYTKAYGEKLMFEIYKSSKIKNKLNLIISLIDKGVNINAEFKESYLLFKSIKHQDEIFTKILIEKGANVNIKDSKQKTPLMYAIKYENGTEIINLLLQNNANIEDMDLKNNTALYYSYKYNYVQAFIILINRVPKNEKDSILKYIISDAFNKKDCTFIRKLTGLTNNNVINNIIDDANNNFKLYKNSNYKPLHQACTDGNTNFCNDLLSLNYDINTMDDLTRETPLMVACKCRNYDIAKLLLNNNFQPTVNVNNQYKNGKTIMSIL